MQINWKAAAKRRRTIAPHSLRSLLNFIWVQTLPVVVPLDSLLATLPQKSAVNIPDLKEMITNMINGTTLQKVPIVLTKEALSTPLLTRKVKAQQKMIATMIDGRLEPPLKTGIKVPIALINMVTKTKLPSQADSQ